MKARRCIRKSEHLLGIINPMSFLYVAVAFFFAGVVPELTGFGVATVSMPILSIVMPLSVVLPLVAIISMVATGVVAWQGATLGRWRQIAVLVAGSAVGVPLGMMFLDYIDEAALSLIFGVFLVLYALYGLFFHQHFLPRNKVTGTIVGTIAGFFGAVFNIHGPLVGLYSADRKHQSTAEIKGLTAAYMFISGVFTVVGHAFYARITPDVAWNVLFALPFLLFGLWVGTKFSHHLNSRWVKNGIYVFVLIVGAVLVL